MKKRKGSSVEPLTKCPECGTSHAATVAKCTCGHVFAAKRSAARKLAGLKQNLMAEKAALEEKMEQLQRRLEAIAILLEE
ncbi:MAG: hypothetical protein ACC628_07660 [Pirellulaceae bacterium]